MEDVGREYSVFKHTIYAWKAKYGWFAPVTHRCPSPIAPQTCRPLRGTLDTAMQN
jgi:hypothetical protein